MFCPVCRDEYREGYTTCAECGAGLVRELPDSAPVRTRADLPENIDELVVLDVMEELDWPMRSGRDPVPPARLPDEHHDRPLPAMVDRLEKLGVPALLLLEGSSFDGLTVFGVTLEAESLYIPETLIPELETLLGDAEPDYTPRKYRLNREFGRRR